MTPTRWFCEGHRKNGIEYAISSGQAGKTYRILAMRLCRRCEEIAINYMQGQVKQDIDLEKEMQSGDLFHMYASAIRKCISRQKVNALLLTVGSDGRAGMTVRNALNHVAKNRLKEIEAERQSSKTPAYV